MLTKSLKDKDTFYYVKRCFHGDNKITFDVLAYEFHPGDELRESSMYDINKMFNTKAEAEICAKILTTQHYCGTSNKTFGFIAHNISPEETLNVQAKDIPIDIVYQDDDVAVINKPQGLTVHAGNGTGDDTLVNALLYHLDKLSAIFTISSNVSGSFSSIVGSGTLSILPILLASFSQIGAPPLAIPRSTTLSTPLLCSTISCAILTKALFIPISSSNTVLISIS
jgi:hypothetical protein